MHKRMKEHLSKFKSKSKDIRESSAFFKHVENEHNGIKKDEVFEDYFPQVNIVKAYKKVLNRSIEEGTFMINHNGEVLNSKTEWNQPRIIRTTIIQGGAEMVGGRVMPCQRAGSCSGGGGTAPTAPLHPRISQIRIQDSPGQVEANMTSRAGRLHARTSG